LVAGHVDQQDHGRFALGWLEEGHGHLAAGHAGQVVERDPQPPAKVEQALGDLPPEVVGERLHHRVFGKLAELGLVPMLGKLVHVGDRDKPFGGIG
jgi:hypothetical protein